MAVPVSWSYDVKLSETEEQKADISQAIDANSVDRFQFRVATDPIYPVLGLYIYLLNIKLIYNEDDRFLLSPPILIDAHPTETVVGFSFHGNKECIGENKASAQDILDKVKSTDNLIYDENTINAIRSWASA